MEINAIGYVKTPFSEKFGIPRQSGIVNTAGTIIFNPPYNDPNAFRGIEDFSHIWVIWGFSENVGKAWSPTVRPPRLGGNVRVGVFASRSPFRPNPIGLSVVKLNSVETAGKLGVVLNIEGADMLNGTPVYDIKPYLPYSESKPEAEGGFAHKVKDYSMSVSVGFNEAFLPENLSRDDFITIRNLLSQDPRPSYQEDDERIYGMRYKEFEIKFKASDHNITIMDIKKAD